MNGKLWLIATSLSFAMTSAFGALPLPTQGVIRFQGSIVEPSCVPRIGAAFAMELGCPAASRGSVISARPVSSVTASDHSAVNVKLVADSGREGRYYNQRYVLVDNAGKPVLSGAYVVTLTSP